MKTIAIQERCAASAELPGSSRAATHAILISKYQRILLLVFLATLPLVNPWVRGDGVGYYAYVHSVLIDHNLDFENEWRAANPAFILARLDQNGRVDRRFYTPTGHIDNHFSVGPSILWAPFLVPVHLAVLTLQQLGVNVRPDGFSSPYIVTMALATALYGFVGLCLSCKLACHYVEERWAFLATVGVWFASSLPVYMYFNPSWSHSHSVFVVALFLWYWHRTRRDRTLSQWAILGLISGLMLDVYYANIAVLLVPLLESLGGYWRGWHRPGHDPSGGSVPASASAVDWQALRRLFAANLLYALATLIAFLPTLITRQIIYGHPLDLGYSSEQMWTSPAFTRVLFSSDHGLLTWTPIIVPALAGLVLLRRLDRQLGTYLLAASGTFCYFIACHSDWDGLASFGNRFFISLTPLFVLGLAVTFGEFSKWLKGGRQVWAAASVVTSLLILWNLAFVFQWGVHLVPARGPISWRRMAHNQVGVVPAEFTRQVRAYFTNRRGLMQRIEQEDIRQLKTQQNSGKGE